jgi:PAS domain S-box-containing protein
MGRRLPRPLGASAYARAVTVPSPAISELDHELAFLTAAVDVANSSEEIATAARVVLRRMLGASGVTLAVVRNEEMHVEGDAGSDGTAMARFPVMALTERYPAAEAVLRERPIYLADRPERIRRYPSLAGVEMGRAWAVVPLRVGDDIVGAMTVVWAHARGFPRSDRRALNAIAGVVARGVARLALARGGTTIVDRLLAASDTYRRPIGLAIGLVALCGAAALYGWTNDPARFRPTTFLLAAIALVAFLSGPRVAAVMTLAGAAIAWLLSEPRWSLAIDASSDVVVIVFFIIGAAIVIGLVTVLSDSTRRLKRTADELAGSQRFMQIALGRSPLGIATVSGDGIVLQANESFGALLDRQYGDLPGTALADLIEPEDRGELARLLAGEVADGDVRFRRGEGIACGHVSVSMVREGHGHRGRALLQIEDVTETRRAQEAESSARRATEEALARLQRLQGITDEALRGLELTALLPTVLTRLRDSLGAESVGFRPAHGLRVEPAAMGRETTDAQLEDALAVLDVEAAEAQRDILRRRTALPAALRRCGIGAALAVPLEAGGRALGVLHVAMAEEVPFDRGEFDLIGLVADRIAIAVDRSLRFEQQRDVANVLRRSLLPPRLPALPGVELVARYWPAGQGEFLGGDFYDVVVPSETTATIFLGDVCGKGVRAASLTAVARHTLRVAAMEDVSPDRALLWLDRAVKGAGDPSAFCTALYVRLDIADDRVLAEIAVGGHPLPFLAHDGIAGLVGQPGSLLGPLDRPSVKVDKAELMPGDVLVLFTDGLIDMPSAAGLEISELAGRIASVASQHGATAALVADALGTDLAVRRARSSRNDDTVLLVLRVTRRDEPAPAQQGATSVLDIELADRAESPGHARRAIAHAIAGMSPAEQVSGTLALLTSELVTNAVRHGQPPLHLTAAVAAERLRVSVTDGAGSDSVAPRTPELDGSGGWGLQLVSSLASAWGVERTDEGKVVWFELDLIAPPTPAAD